MQRGEGCILKLGSREGDELIACGGEEQRGSRQRPKVLV